MKLPFKLLRYSESEAEKKEWEKLENETVEKMKKNAEELVERLTPEELKIYKYMKLFAVIFMTISFFSCWWNLLYGSIFCLFLSTVWFFIWFKKNIRYSLIFYLTFVLSASYFFISSFLSCWFGK